MDELKNRLSEISKIPTEHWQYDGAMCYARIPGQTIEIKHKCPTCGTNYKYEDSVYTGGYVKDRYAEEEEKIGKILKEINALGHHAYVEHMCERCYNTKYNREVHGISIFVLHFRHKDRNKEIVNVVTDYDCEILSEFLKGNNSMRGDFGNTIWFKEYVDLLERLIGIEENE